MASTELDLSTRYRVAIQDGNEQGAEEVRSYAEANGIQLDYARLSAEAHAHAALTAQRRLAVQAALASGLSIIEAAKTI